MTLLQSKERFAITTQILSIAITTQILFYTGGNLGSVGMCAHVDHINLPHQESLPRADHIQAKAHHGCVVDVQGYSKLDGVRF